MLLSDITDRLNYISILNNKETDVCGVCCDTNELFDKAIFVCIRGHKTDGHKFASEAAKKASCIVAEKEIDVDGIPVIYVKDSRKALAEISSLYYGEPSKKLRIIGVTGTNGKTSVTMMIKNILEHCGYKVGLIGTVANDTGTCEEPSGYTTPGAPKLHEYFARMVEENVNYAVMEVSSHAISQYRVHGIEFAATVLTNITEEHLDYHKSMEEYADVKGSLFEHSAISVINKDCEYFDRIKKYVRGELVTYGTESDECDLKAENILGNINGVSFTAVSVDSSYGILCKVPGGFTVSNALAAAATAQALKIPSGFVRMAFKNFNGVKGRVERVETSNGVNVFIDYAHTPDALLKILNTFNEFKERRLITLFGCGGERDSLKRPVMGKIATELSDYTVITSDNPRNEDPDKIIRDIVSGVSGDNYVVVSDRREAIKKALFCASEGDIVLLAGKGHETYQIIGDDKFDFDEREIVKSLI